MWGWISLNVAYVVYALSGLFRDMLRLRIALLAATLLFIAYGVIANIWSVFWWNIPVALVHAWNIRLLIRARNAVHLTAEAEAVRLLLYPDLDRVEFDRLWHTGQERIVTDDVLIEAGDPVEELYLIIEGEVVVERSDADAAEVQLGRLRFIGEMSAINGATASARVSAVGAVRMQVWDHGKLEALCDKNPAIDRAHLRTIQRELTRKLT